MFTPVQFTIQRLLLCSTAMLQVNLEVEVMVFPRYDKVVIVADRQ